MRIGIDLMGSDSPPHTLFSAVLQAAEHLDDSHELVVIATKSVIDHLAASSSITSLQLKNLASISFCEVADAIDMGDNPHAAVRLKKGSSIVVGIRLLKKHQLDAFVSCGNTGALVTSAALLLPMLPGIKRPALLVNLPTEKGMLSTLDVGSTVISKSKYLIQFASLGAAYHRVVNRVKIPKVGLLNIGTESKKGTAEVREAYDHLMQTNENGQPRMNFIGNIEARDIFKGDADVLVTDGFTGNVLLKAAEGVASFIFGALGATFEEEAPASFRYTYNDLQKRFSYAEYPGAIVCGVDGIVMKVHGNGSAKALLSTIMGAVSYVKMELPSKMRAELSHIQTH